MENFHRQDETESKRQEGRVRVKLSEEEGLVRSWCQTLFISWYKEEMICFSEVKVALKIWLKSPNQCLKTLSFVEGGLLEKD